MESVAITNDKSRILKRYFNRELAWIEFNRRVLEEAKSDEHPLLERLKFLIIFSTNLDEFFMIRVAGLKEQLHNNALELSSDGKTPGQQLLNIRHSLLPLLEEYEDCFINTILPELEKQGVIVEDFDELNPSQKDYTKNYFTTNILPVLTPLALDPSHPFPKLLNRSLNIVFILKDSIKPGKKIAVLQVPPVLPRLVELKQPHVHSYVLLEKIIKEYADILFSGYTIEESYCFRVTRDADLEIADDEAADLLTEVAEQVRHRVWGSDAVRLEVEDITNDGMIELLSKALDLTSDDIYQSTLPLNISDYFSLYRLEKPLLKDAPFVSKQYSEFLHGSDELFESIRKKDILVHHPYDSFTSSFVRFIDAAAEDPSVLAIKITLYRAGGSSPVVESLKKAAENGKQVTAFVELRARFDEENNILWSKELEKVGVHVVYGMLGLKIHTKIAMVVRKEAKKIRTYLHLSTGNYNLASSRMYTDIGYFTAREDFAKDAINLFNLLTGYSKHDKWQQLSVAPKSLRHDLLELIARESAHSTKENPGRIVAKMNALVDEEIIQALYKASQHGVRVQLIIRGVCCLIPGIPGLSENIEVISILGRFLEHSRIFYFKQSGSPRIFLSSADWMPRNFLKRIEIMFPILDQKSFNYLEHVLAVYLEDGKKSWKLNSDGTYFRNPSSTSSDISAQQYFLQEISTSKKHPIKLKKID